MTHAEDLAALKQLLAEEQELEFAVLIGSRANGTARANSDWDIALRWNHQLEFMKMLDRHETLRRKIANALGTSEDNIDLIDLHRPTLVMRANVAEEGIVLTGEDTLAWAHFLTRTWRELEDYYWDKEHAA